MRRTQEAACDNCGRVYRCQRRRRPGYCSVRCRVQVHRHGRLDLFDQAERRTRNDKDKA